LQREPLHLIDPPVGATVERVLFAFYLAALLWAPLPFASNQPWAAALLSLLVGGLLCAWLLLWLTGGARIDSELWRVARWPLFLLLLVQGWVLVQTLPLPPAVVAALSPRAFEWQSGPGRLPLSLDPQLTRFHLLRGCTFTAGFFLTLVFIDRPQRVKRLLQVLVVSGTLQAAYGAAMALSGLELGFFVEKSVGRGAATGTFVNRNHLAGYLVMCLAAGTGLLLSQLARDGAGSARERLRRWLQLLLGPKLRLRLYLAVMVVALVLTRSRMGNAAFFCALALAGATALWTGRRFSMRVVALLVSLFVVDMLILGQWFGFERVVERLERTRPAAEARAVSGEYALDYLADFPLTGSGGGSFYGVFPNYQAPDLAGFYQHADNDYLELAAELGLPAVALLALVVALALASAWQAQRRRTPLYRGAGFAATMAIIWAALHSTSDHNLQIPANALTFVTLLALAFICAALPGRQTGQEVIAARSH
jgi:O-antigen ligase